MSVSRLFAMPISFSHQTIFLDRSLHTLLKAHIFVGISVGIILANIAHAMCEKSVNFKYKPNRNRDSVNFKILEI